MPNIDPETDYDEQSLSEYLRRKHLFGPSESSPAMQAYKEEIPQEPKAEDYPASKKRKVGGALAGIATGFFTRNIPVAMAVNRSITEGPYREAQGAFQQELAQKKTLADVGVAEENQGLGKDLSIARREAETARLGREQSAIELNKAKMSNLGTVKPPKSIWDSTRGIFVQPPSEPGGAGSVTKLEGVEPKPEKDVKLDPNQTLIDTFTEEHGRAPNTEELQKLLHAPQKPVDPIDAVIKQRRAALLAGQLNELNTAGSPEANQFRVKQIAQDPRQYHEITAKMKPSQRLALDQAWQASTGLTPPRKLNAQDEAPLKASEVVRDHLRTVEGLIADPEVQKHLGPLSGRSGNFDQWLGANIGSMPEKVRAKMQQLRTQLEALNNQETLTQMGSSRGAQQLRNEIRKVVPQAKFSLPELQGAIRGIKSSNQAVRNGTYTSMFGGTAQIIQSDDGKFYKMGPPGPDGHPTVTPLLAGEQ